MKPIPTFSHEEERALMVQYLLLKLSKNDLHGVMDASADIREIDAAHNASTGVK